MIRRRIAEELLFALVSEVSSELQLNLLWIYEIFTDKKSRK